MIHAKDYSATAVIEQLRCEMCFAVLCFCVDRVSHATRLYYHALFSLSTSFLNFFKNFFAAANLSAVELHSTISLFACQLLDVVIRKPSKYKFLNCNWTKKRNLNHLRFFFQELSSLVEIKETEKEGFEPSRRVNDLHP